MRVEKTVDENAPDEVSKQLEKLMRKFVETVPDNHEIVITIGIGSFVLTSVSIIGDEFFVFNGYELKESKKPVQTIVKSSTLLLQLTTRPRPAGQESKHAHPFDFYIL